MTKTKTMRGRKDYANCLFCQSERDGISQNWGLSPEGWEELKRKHKEEHK